MRLISDPIILQELNDWCNAFVNRIRVEMHNQGINASGNLSNSLEYTITDDADGTHIQVLADPYFFYAEKGRKAGKVPYRFGDILAQWVEDKGVAVPSQFKDARQFGYAIASNIRRYGSKRFRENNPVDVVGSALDEMRPKLNDILENYLITYVNDNLFL